MVALSIVASVTLLINGFLNLYPENQRKLLAKTRMEYAGYVSNAYSHEALDSPITGTKPTLLLVGDSFSQDFYNIIREARAFADYEVSARYVPARCQIYYGVPFKDIRQFIAPGDRTMCQERALKKEDLVRIRNADVVIFAASWCEWAAKRFPSSLDAMKLRKSQTLFVVGPKKFQKSRDQLIRRVLSGETSPRSQVPEKVAAANKALKANLPPEVFVDIIGTVCENGCPLLTSDGNMISYDGSHLTQAGARFLAEQIFTRTSLSKFQDLPRSYANLKEAQ